MSLVFGCGACVVAMLSWGHDSRMFSVVYDGDLRKGAYFGHFGIAGWGFRVVG